MKITPLLSIAGLLVATGCGNKSSAPSSGTNAASGGSVLTAPVDYLSAAARAQQTAVKTIDTTAVSQAVQLFQADRGRLPRDLNELVQEKFLPKIPETPYGMRLDYDATTGEVKVVKL